MNVLLNSNNLSVFHTNIWSMNANFDELEITIKSMKIKPDIFICTETWNIKSVNLYKIEGYDLHYSEGTINIAD